MKALIPLAALGAAFLASSALAQSASRETHSQIVTYADLDLRHPHDVAKLDRRLLTAIKTVCGTTSDFDVQGVNEIRKCRAELGDRAAAQRHHAIVAAQRSAAPALASRQ